LRLASPSTPSPYTTLFRSLRQSSDPGSAYYAVFVTPGNGIVVQYRTAQGNKTLQISGLTGTVPVYLMVSRSGSTYTAYTSSDGTTWTLLTGSSVTRTEEHTSELRSRG